MRKLKLEELNRLNSEEFKDLEKLPVVIVLDNIRSGNNVGAFFRTSDAFKFEKIYLTGITACPPHKEITKSAIGATESVDWEYFDQVNECILKLRKEGYKVLGIEQTDESIELQKYEFKDQEKLALVFGNEVMGISDEILNLLDNSIEIPQFGTKHSLNVSVCGGVVMWEVAKHYF